VTGVAANEQPGVGREILRKFRALLIQIGKDGPTGESGERAVRPTRAFSCRYPGSSIRWSRQERRGQIDQM
jgi:hypothetical protein